MQYAKFPNLYYAWIKYDIPKLYWLVLVVFTVCVCVRVCLCPRSIRYFVGHGAHSVQGYLLETTHITFLI